MRQKINNLFTEWKQKGFKHPEHKEHIRKEAAQFVSKHDSNEIAKTLQKNHEESTEDLILGLEIKYLDWMRGIW